MIERDEFPHRRDVNGSGVGDPPRPTAYDDVASDWMESPASSPDFAPPALTNQWAMLSAGRDFLSYEGFASPPVFAQELQAQVWLSVDGAPLRPLAEMGAAVAHRWRLDRIERRATVDGVHFQSRLALSAYEPVALERLEMASADGRPKRVRLLVRIDALVSTSDGIGDREYDARLPSSECDPARGEWVFGSPQRDAWSAIKASPAPVGAFSAADGGAWQAWVDSGAGSGPAASPCRVAGFAFEFDVEPGKRAALEWVHALGTGREEALAAARRHLESLDERCDEARAAWQAEWEAAFTPGNALFSGHVPTLVSDDPRLRRMYDMAIATVLYCKRTARRGMGGRGFVYATGLPSTRFTFRVTSAFLWDIKMIAGLLSMLDPEALRSMMEEWMEADIHKGYGIDFVTKRPLGFWYAINDHALIHMAWQYIRYTGDRAWLTKEVAGRTVIDRLLESARYWQRIAGDDRLADYGRAENLLECVSTYTHKVASFNAANVWNMRTVAEFLELLGESEEPAKLRREASETARSVLGLYCPGEGFWACKQPDGTLVKVRHVLDFFTVMLNMADDLSDEIKGEMVEFFRRELKEPTWMHALSPLDPDAASSSRTDHQDEGAYTTWPAYSIEALVRAGRVDEAFDWLGVGREGPGIADVARQGPYGQAYYHGGEGSPLVCGAAAKAPLDPPHIEKPVLVSGGKYAQIVIEYLAGLSPKLGGGVEQEETARRAPVRFGLRWVPVQGRLYRVDAGGRS